MEYTSLIAFRITCITCYYIYTGMDAMSPDYVKIPIFPDFVDCKYGVLELFYFFIKIRLVFMQRNKK